MPASRGSVSLNECRHLLAVFPTSKTLLFNTLTLFADILAEHEQAKHLICMRVSLEGLPIDYTLFSESQED